MIVRSSGTQPIAIEQDVVLARQTTRKLATECGMRLIDLTKLCLLYTSPSPRDRG